ncbi:hypothetical protein [Geomonas sp.]|uniref:hypothetical protein n=1 Tax=Geomonas sp. TaxID=2651584 RepID=UPI002B45E91F|nr:hypothetical protein [Geomonas sp.]HJV37099.1 hypothetical protein [Geomonas sp.]
MKKQILAAAAFVMVGALAGCGGGSGSGTSAAGVAAVSGKVADGYLVNATVFMDKNGNYKLDAGEPSTTTDANGNYTLMVDSADIGKYPIVAMATQGVTMDKDTNQAVANSYLLSMPKFSVSGTVNSNFISPMSTELREMMETGKYASMQDAMIALSTKMKLPSGTNMMTDYINGQNGTMHTTAQNMATIMGSQMPQLFSTSGGTTTLDVNRYRGMMGSIFSNMSSVRAAGNPTIMNNLITNMTSYMSTIITGMPYRNMSSSYSGMMGGFAGTGGTMMGGTATGGTSIGGTTMGGTATGGTMM